MIKCDPGHELINWSECWSVNSDPGRLFYPTLLGEFHSDDIMLALVDEVVSTCNHFTFYVNNLLVSHNQRQYITIGVSDKLATINGFIILDGIKDVTLNLKS